MRPPNQRAGVKAEAFLYRHHMPLRWFRTRILCQHASVPGSREFLAQARLAIKERRAELQQELALLDQAEAQLQKNIFFRIRMRAGFTRRIAEKRRTP